VSTTTLNSVWKISIYLEADRMFMPITTCVPDPGFFVMDLCILGSEIQNFLIGSYAGLISYPGDH
jgi:hypothetical protein